MLTTTPKSCEALTALDLLAPYNSLLLAVSGGPDSVALMLLAAQWAGRAERRIAVATVDHGLRAGSCAEAETVGEWARALGFTHHHLTWVGDKPTSRIQERARAARYALLVDCAITIKSEAIVTAHHADDQAETILFRLSRGSGVAGLSGMAPIAPCGSVKLVRPLLDSAKADLEDICQEADHPFIADPSNHDDKYARVRLRQLAPLLAARGLDQRALTRLGRRARQATEALDFYAQSARKTALIESDATSARFDAAALQRLPVEIVLRLLTMEMVRLAPEAQLRLERLERLGETLVAALAEGRAWRATLAGVLLETHRGALILRPAPPRRSP